MISPNDIVRLHYGYFVAPPETRDGGQPIPVCGYLIRHPEGLILFDTGFAPPDEETRLRYQPRAETVEQALARVGVQPSDVAVVVNCHLHADHAGGNSSFPGVPILVQRAELDAARALEYTVPASTHAFDGARLEVLDGESEPLPGVRIVPTPGHSPGHQAMAIESTEGWFILAGQAFNSASELGFAMFARRIANAGMGTVGQSPSWIDRLAELDPAITFLAHDLASLIRDPAALGAPTAI